MPREQESVLGVSSRRSACDRCRSQKLRCLREHADQARCDRCTRADSECIQSPIFRMRGYSGDDRTRKRQRQHHHYSPPHARTPGSGGGAYMNISAESHATAPETFPFEWDTHRVSSNTPEGHQGVAVAVTASATGPWEPENLPYDMVFDDGVDQTFEPFVSTPGFQENNFISRSSLLIPSPPISQPGPSLASSRQSTATVPPNAASSVESGSHTTSESSFGTKSTPNSTSSSELEGTPMQRLSKVNFNLITLLDRIDKGPPHVTLDTLVSPADESKSSTPIVDEVLSNTKDLLDVLKTLTGPIRSSSPVGTVSSADIKSRASKSIARGRQSSYSSSISGSDDSMAESPADSLMSTESSLPPLSDGALNPKLDMALSLLLLTTYVHVLRLYVVLFVHIYDHLKEISNSDDPYLCPVPGLSFSSFPIQSGNLQTMILIQIVTSLFERMEAMLGLPREFRMNTRRIESRGAESEGLLSHRDFIKILHCAIRNEESGQPEHGKGGIKVLRTRITRTKQLLRDCIAP